MNLEIRKPESVKRVNAYIRAGGYKDADEVVEKALDALDEKTSAPKSPEERRRTAMSNNVRTVIFWLVVICMALLLWAVVNK